MPVPKPATKKNKCIGIVGSRRRTMPADFVALYNAFYEVYEEGDSIVSGGCKEGADKWAEWLAEEVGVKPIVHKPKFNKEPIPQCYFSRNTLIAVDCDVLLAVVAEDRTGGTEDTVRKAEGMGKPVTLL